MPGHACSNRMNRSGRWRSEYRIDLQDGKVDGKILVNVHYYEQGNVSLPAFIFNLQKSKFIHVLMQLLIPPGSTLNNARRLLRPPPFHPLLAAETSRRKDPRAHRDRGGQIPSLPK